MSYFEMVTKAMPFINKRWDAVALFIRILYDTVVFFVIFIFHNYQSPEKKSLGVFFYVQIVYAPA